MKLNRVTPAPAAGPGRPGESERANDRPGFEAAAVLAIGAALSRLRDTFGLASVPAERGDALLILTRNMAGLLGIGADRERTAALTRFLEDELAKVAQRPELNLADAAREAYARLLQSPWAPSGAAAPPGAGRNLGRPTKTKTLMPVEQPPRAAAAPAPTTPAPASRTTPGASATALDLAPRERLRAVAALHAMPVATSAVQRTLRALGARSTRPEQPLDGLRAMLRQHSTLVGLQKTMPPGTWGALSRAGLGAEKAALDVRLKAELRAATEQAHQLMQGGAGVRDSVTAGGVRGHDATAAELAQLRDRIQMLHMHLTQAALLAGRYPPPAVQQIDRWLRSEPAANPPAAGRSMPT